MRLSEFIDSTLYEIALGTQMAKVHGRELMAVAPNLIEGRDVSGVTNVQFDVALAITAARSKDEGGGAKAGAEVNISVVKAHIDADGTLRSSTSKTSEETHRVAFSIPIYLTAHFRAPDALRDEAAVLDRIRAGETTSD